MLQMCPADAVYDGHSTLLVGYRDDANHPGGRVSLFRNTDNGGHDGSMQYTSSRACVNDAVWTDADR
jgi:hypothetical protein